MSIPAPPSGESGDVTAPGLLEALADPAFHGGLPVTMHETHTSWVFLAGQHAYKIKKPVALGFLDYSTLERRRAACAEEVRVNRELAPGIYLGVRAILRRGTSFSVSAHGDEPEAIEYAVEMRRFSDADTLSGLLASGELTDADLDAVARRVAVFHHGAPTVSGGSVEQVSALWRENIRELEEAGRGLHLDFGVAERFGDALPQRHEVEIEARRTAGLVRDGHGDLRCEHVLVRPTVRIVDRIEFDPALRRADICSDLAFLTMDLEASGRSDAAERVLRTYRGCKMSAGSDALLSFYGAHRALIRAKVSLISAGAHDGQARADLLARSRSMLELAERLGWRSRAPLVVVLSGPPASGKSTLAAELGSRSGLEVLSSDAVRKSAVGLKATERATPEAYSADLTDWTYARLSERALTATRERGGAIIDATCGRRADRKTLLGPIARAGLPCLVVHCVVPLEVALERARQRATKPDRISDAGPDVVARLHRSFEPLDELATGTVLELDGRMPLDAQISAVTGALDHLGRRQV